VIELSELDYWAQYYRLFNSSADVYSLVSAQDVREALSIQPTNVANLIHVLSHHLFSLLPSSVFPSSASSSNSEQDPTKEALNCLRVLGRVLVLVYEGEGSEVGDKDESFGYKWLWSRQHVERRKDEHGQEIPMPESEESQFALADDDDEDDEEDEQEMTGEVGQEVKAFKAAIGHPQAAKSEEIGSKVDGELMVDPLSQPTPPKDTGHDGEGVHMEENTIPCLIDRLFSCTIDLLFCAGFTVPASVPGQDGTEEKINYVIWEKGVGSTVSVGSSTELDRNKTEHLNPPGFLIILVSSTIYTPPNVLHSTTNPPLEHLTHSLERRLVLSLLCSLLNTSLTPSKYAAGIGGQIPYTHLISKAADERRTLVRASFMMLLVALDYRRERDISQMGEGKDENAFRYFVSKLHRKEDFSFILEGTLGILEEHAAVNTNYLPGSKRPVPYILENFMLLWRIVDLNKRFRQYIFDSGKAMDIIGYILLTCLELKDDPGKFTLLNMCSMMLTAPAQHGLLRLLSYLLQTLSADQAFAQALNKPIRLSVPAKWAVTGSAADFMIVSIYSIATTPGLNPLFPALTISVANVAPYLQNIGVQASTRLMQLFKAFSAPNFLLADEGHPRLVYYLLETFNSILYHRLNENPNLVYAVLRSHQDFQTLATFTLVSGLREIQRRKALRVTADAKALDEPRVMIRTNSELDMLAEKAALLGRREADEEPNSPMEERRSRSPTSVQSAARPPTPPSDLIRDTDPLSVTSPMYDPAQTEFRPQPLSEKARGKMRATDSAASLPSLIGEGPEIPDEELMKVASSGVGPNGYIPTQDWVSSWQKGLPLDPVLVAISELLPKIQDSQPRAGAPSSKVFKVLKGCSLSDVLPPAQPIIPRRFQWSPASAVWLTSLLWGDIYVAGLTSIGLWRDTTVGRILKMIGVV
ncbi:MAG: hypothetical protein TREMPRED_003499, partial [Tremellales sp. Tagirdzhanova-0007]